MHTQVSGVSKNVVILINDFFPELGTAIEKLSEHLKRPLKGVILIDKEFKEQGKNKPDTSGKLSEIVCDFSSLKSISNALKPIKDQILLVTCSSERSQPYFKKILPHLPYVLAPTEHSLDWSTHKTTMRELLRSFDPESVPRFMQITENSPEHIKSIEEHIKYPVIVKPNGLAASILVNKANNQEELETYLKHGFEVIEEVYSRDVGRGEPSMVIEEFIDGDMYSVDSYVNEDGEVYSLEPVKVTTAASIGKEGYYSYRLDTNHGLSRDQVSSIHKAAERAIHALGLRSSVAHIELFNSADGWKIIELGPRPGGYRQDMYWLGYGVDHAFNELLIKIGEKPYIPEEPIAYSAAINIYAEQEGVIREIKGLEEARRNSSVYSLEFHGKVGDQALFAGNGGKLIIDGVLHNKDFEQLNRDIETVRNLIEIEVEPA